MNSSERRELERLLNTDEQLDPEFLADKFQELATTTPSVGAEEAALGWRLLTEFIQTVRPDTFVIPLQSETLFPWATRIISNVIDRAIHDRNGKTETLQKSTVTFGTVALDIAAGDVVHFRGPILAGLPENQIDIAAAFCGSMKAAAKDPVGFASGFPN